jgi:vacuolar-type H+-ATPase catalytic subunit A/Vma1
MYLWEKLGYTEFGNNPLTIAKEDTMSYAIQDAVEECIDERIASQIEEAIDDSTEVQQLKSDVQDLEAKVEELRDEHDQRLKEIISDTIREDIVNQALYKLTDTLVDSLYGNQEYQLVKKSYLVNLKTELDMIKKQQEEGGQQ